MAAFSSIPKNERGRLSVPRCSKTKRNRTGRDGSALHPHLNPSPSGVGNILLPAVAALADKMAGAISIVDGLAQKFPMLTTVVVGGTAALIGIKIAAIAGRLRAHSFVARGCLVWLHSIPCALPCCWLPVQLVAQTNASKTAIVISKAITAQWLWNAALTANPIGLVIVKLPALSPALRIYKSPGISVTFFFFTTC